MKKQNKKGQFTSEVHSTKKKWWWKGFTAVNWVIALSFFLAGVLMGKSL